MTGSKRLDRRLEMCAGVGKSGSPISRWMTSRVASIAWARANTAKADSAPELVDARCNRW
jgi:hypothetical protein